MGITEPKKDNDYEEIFDFDDEIIEQDLTEDLTSDDLSDEVTTSELEDPTWIDKLTGAIPTGFKDWLYEAERSDLGGVDIGTYDDDLNVMDVVDPSERGLDRLSDVGRGVIQSGAYVGDFWKDLAMAPYRLFQGEGFKDQYEHLIDNPQWAEDIGYESDYGQAIMDNPAVRAFQEHILPFSGAGIIGAASRIPKAGKILQMMYPTTSAMAKMGKAKVKDYAGIIGRALYGKPWGPMLPKPGSLGFNVGLPWAIGQGKRKVEGKPSVFDMAAHAADVPSRGGYAAGQMPTPVRRPVTPRHPREMMEMANTRRPGPRDDYRGL